MRSPISRRWSAWIYEQRQNCKRASCEIARRLLLRNLLSAGNVFLLLACGGRLCLFLRRRLARGFRRLVAHRHNAKVHGDRRQLNGRERAQRAPAPWVFGKDRPPIKACVIGLPETPAVVIPIFPQLEDESVDEFYLPRASGKPPAWQAVLESSREKWSDGLPQKGLSIFLEL